MNDFDRLSPQDQAALDALRKLTPPTAPDETRVRARAAFLAAAKPVARRRSSRRRIWWMAVPVAAALALMVYGAQPRSSWVVVDLKMGDEITLAGQTARTGLEVRSGKVVTTPCSEVELSLEDKLNVRFLSDARAELPPAPGRWLGRERTLKISQGEVFGSSGKKGLDYRLILETDEARAVLTGTTFAALRLEDATCFCLYSGSIEFTPKGSTEAISLPVGQRVLIYKDGRDPRFEPLNPMEQMKLQMLHDAQVSKDSRP